MIGNFPAIGFMLMLIVLVQVLLLASVAGRKLDTQAIKDVRGRSRSTRERSASFYYSVVLIGIISITAGYAMSLAASWTLEFADVGSKSDLNPGILAAGGVIIVFEILVILVARSHDREVLLGPADVRFELSQLSQEGVRRDSARLSDLKGQLDRIKAENLALRSTRRLNDRFKERYEELYDHNDLGLRDELIVVKRTNRLSLGSWFKYILFWHGLMLGRFRVVISISLIAFLIIAIILSLCLEGSLTTFIFFILAFLVALTYLIDSKNALLQIAKSQVLLRAQIEACDLLVADLESPSVDSGYSKSYKFGRWEILRRM